MAVVKIQHRRGTYSQYDPTKVLPAELVVVQSGHPDTPDGKAILIGTSSGDVKRIPTADELSEYNAQSAAVYENMLELATTVGEYATNAQTKANEASESAQNAATAKSQIDTIMETAESTINGYASDAKDDAVAGINAAYTAREDDLNDKIDAMLDVKTEAETIATEAKNKVDDVENEVSSLSTTVNSNTTKVNSAQTEIDGMIHDWYVDVQKRLIFVDASGNQIGEPIEGIGGSGGGGGGGGDTTGAILTVTNTTGWLAKTVNSGADCNVSFTWSSVEDDLANGAGTLRITNNNAFRASMNINQGAVTVNLKNYLTTGSNVIRLQVTDITGQSRTLNFSVTVIQLTISSTFDTSSPFDGVISFPYTPVGEVEKTVHFILDGTELTPVVTSVSNRQLTYTIPAQSHGGHTLRVYFTATINSESVLSNELYYEFISIEALNNTVIIVSPFNKTTVEQYSMIQIPYTVYNPAALTAQVTISANGTTVSTQTVDRSEQSYSYRADATGTLTLAITSGTTTKTFTLSVTESSVDVEAETENLALFLSAAGRSNNEANPGTWTFGTGNDQIACIFTDFNFVSDGWQQDTDGSVKLKVSGDARLTIPYKPFAEDFRTSGKTIELEFSTENVLNYDATILSCMNGNRGIAITSQKAILKSEQSEISTQYKENEHVRVAFVCEKRAENRLLYIYINGIMSGAVQYPADDDFSQASPVNISVGSSDCTINLYCIRIYDNNLNSYQIVDNWIADTQDGGLMTERYIRNNIFDAYGNIVISKLPVNLPYMIRTAEELPQYKGDKKTISIDYVNPAYPSKSFSATNVQSDVQGTSSQYYPRKNYKDKYKSGFRFDNNQTANKYAMNEDAIPVNTFTMKADVASSEGANNVELARLYNDACPYKTPPQVENSKVRQGIDGFPIVMFWNDGERTSFLGKYNFNNDKGTKEVFGFADPDESWEIKNNTSDRVLWKSDDYTGSDWLNDFEARYPDTDPAYEDAEQLATFASWVKSTDTTAATNNALSESVTYDGTTYTTDSAAYRLAKFKAEAGNYMEMQSALFYYLFTELFLMVDSRAKNAFPSFMGASLVSGSEVASE